MKQLAGVPEPLQLFSEKTYAILCAINSTHKKSMASSIITTEDLQQFKREVLDEIRKLLTERPVEPAQRWLKSYQIRKILSISPGKLHTFRTTGILPYTRLGNMIFYDYYEIEKLLHRNKHVKDSQAQQTLSTML